MKLKHVHPKNVAHLIPSWLENPFTVAKWLDAVLDELYGRRPSARPARWDKKLSFWFEIDFDAEPFGVRVCEDDDRDRKGLLITTKGGCTVVVPLNPMLKGAQLLTGTHLVYSHTIMTECPLAYVGVTKQTWFDRYAQHRRAAASGSGLIFHSALRDHDGLPMVHRVMVEGLDYQSAMQLEEEFVEGCSLYPKGLNMIPGGFAGLRYLASLGITARSVAERDAEIEKVANRQDLNGKPNPLCAARWAADQDFVNRVICGHSGRLTLEQVRAIKLHTSFGREPDAIAEDLGLAASRVKAVAAGKVYGRVL